MRIAFVNNNYRYGGAETVMQQLRAGCRRAGHRTTLSVDKLNLYDRVHYPWERGLRPLYPRLLQRLSQHPRLGPIIAARVPRAATTDRRFRALAAARVDVVHVHSFHGDYATVESLAHVARHRPLVWTFHGFWGITGGCDNPFDCRRYTERCGACPQLGGWRIGPIDRTAEELARKRALLAPAPIHVVAPSRHLAATVQESPVGRRWSLHHIPNGVDPAQFGCARKRDPDFRSALGLDRTATLVLVVNRDFRAILKGFPLIARALSRVDPRGVQVVLVGHDAAWAARTVNARMPCRVLEYVGDRTHLAALHEAADVLLYASAAENFPCSILEGMAAGCCVVSTPTGGVVEQVEHARSGLLARDGSSESLGAALAEALARPDEAARLGRAARARVEQHFTEEQMVARHLTLYTALARSHPAGTGRG